MTKAPLMIVPAILLAASIAHAKVTDKDVARCAAIEGDLARLVCYDALAKANKLDGEQPQPVNVKETGKWDVNVKTNPIDDSKTVALLLKADSGQGRFGKGVYLILRCQSNETDLYVSWNDYLGDNNEVLSRIGTEAAVTSRWGMSTDKQASFHPKPIPFIKNMLKAHKFVAQVTPYGESPITAVFYTAGLDSAIKPLRETCHW